MAEGRFLSRSIAHSEQLGRVSLEADYLFMRCIPHLDRDGRMPGNPELVRALVCPLRSELTVPRVGAALEELATVGLVIRYEAESRQCLAFPGFDRHQKGLRKDREAPSRFPAPEGNGRVRVEASSGPSPDEPAVIVPQNAVEAPHPAAIGAMGSTPDLLLSNSGPTPAEVEVEVEVEVKGSSRTTSARAARRLTWLTPFGDVWHAVYGGEPAYGELAAHLKPICDAHDHGDVLEHWTRYLEATDAKYVSPARFAQTYGKWGKPKAPEIDTRPDYLLTLEEQELRRTKLAGRRKPNADPVKVADVLPKVMPP